MATQPLIYTVPDVYLLDRTTRDSELFLAHLETIHTITSFNWILNWVTEEDEPSKIRKNVTKKELIEVVEEINHRISDVRFTTHYFGLTKCIIGKIDLKLFIDIERSTLITKLLRDNKNLSLLDWLHLFNTNNLTVDYPILDYPELNDTDDWRNVSVVIDTTSNAIYVKGIAKEKAR